MLCLVWVLPALLLSAAGKEALKQSEFPLFLQSPFFCEKGSGAIYLETNGSQAGRRVLSFFPPTNHTVYIGFFFRAIWCHTSEWNQKWVSKKISIFLLGKKPVVFIWQNTSWPMLSENTKSCILPFSRASCIFIYEFVSLLPALLFLLSVLSCLTPFHFQAGSQLYILNGLQQKSKGKFLYSRPFPPLEALDLMEKVKTLHQEEINLYLLCISKLFCALN